MFYWQNMLEDRRFKKDVIKISLMSIVHAMVWLIVSKYIGFWFFDGGIHLPQSVVQVHTHCWRPEPSRAWCMRQISPIWPQKCPHHLNFSVWEARVSKQSCLIVLFVGISSHLHCRMNKIQHYLTNDFFCLYPFVRLKFQSNLWSYIKSGNPSYNSSNPANLTIILPCCYST